MESDSASALRALRAESSLGTRLVSKLRNQHRHLAFFRCFARAVKAAEAVTATKDGEQLALLAASSAATVEECQQLLSRTIFMREALLVGACSSRLAAAGRVLAKGTAAVLAKGSAEEEAAGPDADSSIGSVLLAGARAAKRPRAEPLPDASAKRSKSVTVAHDDAEQPARGTAGLVADALGAASAGQREPLKLKGRSKSKPKPKERSGTAQRAKAASKLQRKRRPLALDQGFG